MTERTNISLEISKIKTTASIEDHKNRLSKLNQQLKDPVMIRLYNLTRDLKNLF